MIHQKHNYLKRKILISALFYLLTPLALSACSELNQDVLKVQDDLDNGIYSVTKPVQNDIDHGINDAIGNKQPGNNQSDADNEITNTRQTDNTEQPDESSEGSKDELNQ